MMAGSVDADLVSQYLLDDNLATTDVVDSQGVNAGTLAGGDNTDDLSDSGPAGALNTALLLNGTDDHIDCGSGASLDITALSISVWVKLAIGYSAEGRVLSKGTISSTAFFLEIDADKKVSINGGNSTGVPGDEVLPEGEWAFVGVSYSTTTGKIYVNDSAPETKTITTPASQTVLNLKIGVRDGIAEGVHQRYFDGHIADVRVYNRVLTDAEFETIRREMIGVVPRSRYSDGYRKFYRSRYNF